MTNDKYTTRLTILVFVLMTIIGGIGFTLSYEALMTVAQDHGKSGWLGVLWPLIIDAPIVAFSLAAVIAAAKDRSAATPRGVVILATVATIAYNWFHAYAPGVPLMTNVVAVSVAVMAPVMYFLSFEVSLWLIGVVTDVTPEPDKKPDIHAPKPAIKPAATTPKAPLQPDKKQDITTPNPAKKPASKPAKSERQAVILANLDKTQAELAKMLNVSTRTISREIEALNGQMSK